MSDRVEFLAVTTVAFGYLILVSLAAVVYPSTQPAVMSDSHLHSLVRYEAIVLIVLAIFLYFRGWSFRGVGLRLHPTDPAIGLGLAVLAYAAYYFVYAVAEFGVPGVAQPGPSSAEFTLGAVILVSLLNPIFEEVLVCGYVVSYFRRSKRGFWFAVNTSVALRLAYHLYQGAFGVISIVPLGLVFTYWFARTGRLWPIIIAHAIFDFVALVAYV